MSAYFPGDVPWEQLPQDVSLSMHWHRTLPFEGFLRQYGFRIMVMARHPLDVLLSILSYAQRDEEGTRKWLYSECGDERTLVGAPDQRRLRALRARARARRRCSTSAWPGRRAPRSTSTTSGWCRPRTRNSGACARRWGWSSGSMSTRSWGSTRPTRCARPLQNHYWQGAPGLWKRLIVPSGRRDPRAAPAAFETFGYACDPTPV